MSIFGKLFSFILKEKSGVFKILALFCPFVGPENLLSRLKFGGCRRGARVGGPETPPQGFPYITWVGSSATFVDSNCDVRFVGKRIFFKGGVYQWWGWTKYVPGPAWSFVFV